MKQLQWLLALGLTVLSVLSGIACLMNADEKPQPSRADQWKKVEEAESQGLPRSAIELLDPIIQQALKEKAYPEAIKAIARKINNESSIEDDAEKITRMQAAIASSPAEMQPVMNVILAHWWRNYLEGSAWRISDRTKTSELADSDIRTWDADRILTETDKTFAKALASEKELKATPVGEYSFLLQKGSIADRYRPTLFDIVAFDAVNFYASGGLTRAKPEDAFELPADSPAFGTSDEFLKWEPKATDPGNRTVKAIRLYQKLLAFHKDDKDRSAFLDVDLHRLRFAGNRAVGDNTEAKYKAALEQFAKVNASHELSALARYLQANAMHRVGEYVQAHTLATLGSKAFPDSAGGKLCFNLILTIESKSATTSTEWVWGDPLPTIRVRYKNITKAYFWVVAADYAQRLNGNTSRPETLNEKEAKALLREKPVLEFSRDLPATPDFKERTESIPAPAGLKPGFYYLVVSYAKDFGETDNTVHCTSFWVSNLALVTRELPGGDLGGLVTDSHTGEPIEAAKVELWLHNNRAWNKTTKAATTDKNGLFRFGAAASRSATVVVTHNNHQIANVKNLVARGVGYDPGDNEQVVFFTDRSLYRPGQTIQYKGIFINCKQSTNSYETVANREVEVAFYDTNEKEIARHKTKTNAFGSFSDTFIAPRNRLLGEMTIRAHRPGELGGGIGLTSVTIEEYKRPRFKVVVDAPTEATKLNTVVKLSGKATQYNGVSVSGAKVAFRVVRGVQFPASFFDDFGWWPMPAESQLIAHGTVTTEADGSFTIPFLAKPDTAIPEREHPTFQYTVTADVTDTTGETRSAATTVNVGYVALRASIGSEEWLTNDKESVFRINTATFDDVGLSAKGRFRIHAIKQPNRIIRPELQEEPFLDFLSASADKPQSWELGDEVFSTDIETKADGKAEVKAKLPPGIYRAVLDTRDKFGRAVTARRQLTVVNPTANQLKLKVPNLVIAPKWSVEVGEEFVLLWGTGYDAGRAFIEIEHHREIVKAFWTEKDATQQVFRMPVTEGMRGGFTVHVTQVRENRQYIAKKKVEVPWSNKDLVVRWERFVSKLEPGIKETFTAVVTGPDAKKAVAEMVAAMYDESLDAHLPHDWMQRFDVFRKDYSRLTMDFNNTSPRFQQIHGTWKSPALKEADLVYRGLPPGTTSAYPQYFEQDGGSRCDFGSPNFGRGFQNLGGGFGGGFGGGGFGGGFAGGAANVGFGGGALGVGGGQLGVSAAPGAGPAGHPMLPARNVELNRTSARKNLSETAFFLPHLTSDEAGTVRMQFTMPESLTRWKFLGFAHDKALRSGFITGSAVTARDLMVQPNPPRFLREGDIIEFTVKVSNQGESRQKGTARLSFKDANTDKPADTQLGLANADQSFDLAPKESKTLSWKLTIPDDMGPIAYRAVAATERLSDGEEGLIPVLARRVLVQESLPLPIRGPGAKEFDFTKLRLAAKSDTVRHQSLTVQMVSQPSWYAVMALPYLMEYPHECSEQTFSRLYANALARHIANKDPKIRKVFDQWKATPALDSPLEKNQDLKSVILEETPWVQQAQAESRARRNVGMLFDHDRLETEAERASAKLAQMQLENGLWPWFPGGPGSEYLTLYITTGFGRLRHLGVKVETPAIDKALDRLDSWAHEQSVLAQKHKPEANHLSPTMAMYLYGRSFFLEDKAIDGQHRPAIDYWQGQAKKFWLPLGNRQSQAQLAIALKRFGDKETPGRILKSIKERSKNEEELGMYWRDTELSFSWFHAPIETQAMMIEAFDEVLADKKAVEDCKVWLLKQKQTQNWHTTKATADAVYALLLRGDNLLASDALVEVTLGNQLLKPEKIEAGTGFYEHKFLKSEVQPAMAAIQVKKSDKGVSWGSVHWSYLEDLSKVTPHEGTPLKLEKKLFKKSDTPAGRVLVAIKNGDTLAVGDEVIVRVVLRADRDLEYVHMKDHRGSGTEPVNVLSRYKYQDGLGYYESTKDMASHFFIDYLPKGTYVFEYPVRVQLKGKYGTGFAHIECMYAPEFNSHSENINLEVK